MVLADLYAVAHSSDCGGIAVGIQYLRQLLSYLRDRFILGHQRLDVLHEALEASPGEAANRLWAPGIPQRGQRFRRKLVVGVSELSTALIGEAKVFGWAATARRVARAGRRAAAWR